MFTSIIRSGYQPADLSAVEQMLQDLTGVEWRRSNPNNRNSDQNNVQNQIFFPTQSNVRPARNSNSKASGSNLNLSGSDMHSQGIFNRFTSHLAGSNPRSIGGLRRVE